MPSGGKARKIYWTGAGCHLTIERYWQNFWGHTPVCYLDGIGKKVALPMSWGDHLIRCYDLAQGAHVHFADKDSWYSFSVRTCSQYCEAFVLKRAGAENAFVTYFNTSKAVADIAMSSAGYHGPKHWWEFAGEHP